MNLGRGFRRIVLTIPFAVASAGLVVTAYDTYEDIAFVSGINKWFACANEIKSRTPTESSEDFWTQAGSDGRLSDCEHFTQGRPTPSPFFPRFTTFFWSTATEIPIDKFHLAYTRALLPLTRGVLLSTVFGALPWGAAT